MDFADTRTSTAGLGILTGTATSVVTAGQASVDVGGTVVVANAVRGLTIAAGDVVLLARQGSAWWMLARLYTAAPAPPEDNTPAPPPKPQTVTGRLVVAPVRTATFRGGSWRGDTSDVVQGDWTGAGNNTGCAFYGSKPRSLAGAIATKARLRVRRQRGGVFGSQTATLRLVTQATKPAGAPTLTSSTTGPTLAVDRTDNDFVVPTSWAQDMIDGNAGGLAVFDSSGSPYMVFAGRSSWGPAWTLTIDWKRSS